MSSKFRDFAASSDVSRFMHFLKKVYRRNSLKKILPVVFMSLFMLSAGVAKAQKLRTELPKDTAKTDQVIVDFADLFEYIVEGKVTYQKLLGNVELRQDSVYMYCDSAIIKDETFVTAGGHVLIQHGDSISVFADSATYDGLLKISDLYGDVVLLSGNQKLFTDSLHYDLNTKIATYNGGATLTNDTTQLRSKRGYYYVNEKVIYFRDDVVVVSPDFSLKADTLKFNTESRVVEFLGPTLISTTENGKIYCESGFYNIPSRTAEFRQNAQYEKEDQKATAEIIQYDGNKQEYNLVGNARFEDGEKIATADEILYDEKNDKSFLKGQARYRDGKQNIVADEIIYDAKNDLYSTKGRSKVTDQAQILEADKIDFDNVRGTGVADGNVIWRDTVEKITVLADLADYDKKKDYLKTRGGRPLLMAEVEGDTLFMRADTLISQRRDTAASDSSRILLAYNHVRIYKRDLQAVSDSLTYSMGDSLFKFYNEPIIWSDTTQFFADTMHIQMANNKIDKIFLFENSFIINSPDNIFFNQIKGKHITAFFEERELRKMRVDGNAESVYYLLDDSKAYIGANKTICSEMLLYFGDNKVDEIKFFAQPQATLFPMGQAQKSELELKGFRWISDVRPKSKNDL